MRTYELYHVDAFTSEPLKGNAAAVLPDALGLSGAEMQAIAREMNLSETAFVFPPEGPNHDICVRFFSPSVEVPLCGHATVALHHVRVAKLGFPCGTLVQKTAAGLVPVKVGRDEHGFRVEFGMRDIAFGRVMGKAERVRILSALGVPKEEWDGRFPMQKVYAGVMVCLKKKSILDSLMPDMGALAKLSSELGFDDFVVFTTEAVDPKILTHVRVFAPKMGIDEDPVTGSANGPLAAYLAEHALIEREGDRFEFLSRQGEAMGRPGTVELRANIVKGRPAEIFVGGRAVTLFKTAIEI